MPKTLLILSALLLAAFSLTACDQQSSQNPSSAQAKLDNALSLFGVAERGFVDAARGDALPVDIQAFRQDQLAKAATDLQAVISSGSPEQKAIASKLLASIKQSAARYATRDALAEFAAISARSPVLIASLQAAERASTELAASDVDYDAQLAQLAADANTLAQQQTQLQQQADALVQQQTQAQAQQKAEQQKASAALAQAETQRQAAFVAENVNQKMTQQDAADVSQRSSAQASAEAEKQQVQIDMLQRRLDVVNTQLATVASQIANLKQQADQTRQMQTDAAAKLAQLQKTRDDQAAALKDEFDKLVAVYQTSVSQPLTQAAAEAAEATKLLASAGGQDLLAARVDEAHINSQHAIVTATCAGTVGMLANVSQAANLAQAAEYKAAYDQLKTEYDQAAAAADEAIKAGLEMAGSVNGDAAAAMAQRLQQYQKALKANALK